MRLVLRKVLTTAAERTTARTMQSDLRLPEDAVRRTISIPRRRCDRTSPW